MIVALKRAWSLYGQVPLTDPVGYTNLALHSRFFFDTTPREPLHIFLVKMALPFYTTPDPALRILTAIFTFIAFGLLAFWVRKRVGYWPAIFATLSFSSCSLALYYSVQGFNMVSYYAFLLLFLTVWEMETSWWWLGIVAGLTGLTRLEGLPICALCLVAEGLFKFRQEGWKTLRRALGAALIAFLMVSPYFIHQKIAYGSFLYSHHVHAAFWANREIIAQNGFHEPATGLRKPMGLFQYFTDKGLVSGVVRYLKGFGLAFIWYMPRVLQGAPWLWLFLPFGLVWAARRRRWKPFFLWVATILPVAFILPVDAIAPHSGVEMRFLLPSVPLLCAFGSMGIAWFLEKAAPRLS